jgi:hypothetical protein
MNHYLIWCDLVDTRRDLEFARNVGAFLGHLQEEGRIVDWSLARCKFGFNQPGLGEFMIRVRTESLEQLDSAFGALAPREGPPQALHAKVYSMVTNFRSALFRDFPDAGRTAELGGGDGH